MNGSRQLLRVLAIIASIALIAGAFFNFTAREEPKPLFRLDTPHAASTPADEGLEFSAPGLDGKNIALSHYREIGRAHV